MIDSDSEILDHESSRLLKLEASQKSIPFKKRRQHTKNKI